MNATRCALVVLVWTLAGILGPHIAQGADESNELPQAQRPGFDRPTVIRSSKPVYPAEMKRRRITGSVLVQFDISEKGDAVNVSIVSSTHTEFERPAVTAVRKMKFRPGTQDGIPVVTRAVQQRMSFGIK